MYERFFLEGTAATKYDVFKYLNEHGDKSITVAQIAKALRSSYSKAQHATELMTSDLQSLQHRLGNEQAAQASDFRVISANIAPEDYRYFLLLESPTFRFYDQVFQGENVSMAAFAKDQGVSVSTMRRKIEPFREYLVSQGVVLDIRNWSLSGNELAIRIFLESLYTDLYNGKTWPLRRVDEAQVTRLCASLHEWSEYKHFQQTSFVTSRERIVLGLQIMRINCGHFFTPSSAFNVIHSQQIPEIPIFSDTNFPQLAPHQLSAESKYAIFNSVSRLNYSAQDTELQRYIRGFFEREENPVVTLVQGVLDALQSQMTPMARAYLNANQTVITNLYRVVYTYYIVGGRFTTVNRIESATADALRSRQGLTDVVAAYIRNIPTRNPEHVFSRFLPDIAQTLITVMLPVLNEYAPHPLVLVRLELEYLDSDIVDLMNLLTTTGVISLLPDSSQSEADIIITASTSIDPMIAEMTGDFVAAERLRSREAREHVLYWNPEHDLAEVPALRRRILAIAANKCAAIAAEA
jgi:hypothetical protein